MPIHVQWMASQVKLSCIYGRSARTWARTVRKWFQHPTSLHRIIKIVDPNTEKLDLEHAVIVL
jgi:murein endopeptidase